jgi:hypothetical protein
MSFPPEAFFASVFQTNIPGSSQKITNFPLPSNSFFIGIPYIIGFVVAFTPSNASQALQLYDPDIYDAIDNIPLAISILNEMTLVKGCTKKIGLWGSDGTEDINFQKEDETFPESTKTPPVTNYITKAVMMYTNHGYFQFGKQLYYFSTLDNGTTLYYGADIVYRLPPFPPVTLYTIPDLKENPGNDQKYNVYRYFTDLKYGDVNLNITPSFLLGWSSSDITGDYGEDEASLTMYKENGIQQGVTIPVTYNYPIDSTTTIDDIKVISTIPSGRYYYVYDFVSVRIAFLQAAGIEIYYSTPPKPSDNPSLQTTPVFTFITKFLQSITAGNIAPGGTTTINPDFGIGYAFNTYQITVNDSTNSTRRSVLPYNYTPPITVNTRTYRVTVNSSSDSFDTGSHIADFIAYQYVANLAVATRVIGSARNYLTWTGGSLSEQFQYNTTFITTNGSTNFTSGLPVDTAGLVAGVGYPIVPTNGNENSGSYSTIYFDSITPNTLIISSANTQQQYTLSWTSYYNYINTAPDGSREYPVTVTGNGTTMTFTSLYNVVLLPYSAITYGVPYAIQVLDITIETNVYFYDPPTNVTITPSYINFPNIIRWTSATPTFNVIMNDLEFQGTPPTEQNLTEDTSGLTGDILFWPVGSTPSNAFVGGTYSLTANTLFLSLGESISIFQGIELPFNFDEYLYPSDDFSLSLYRNGEIVQELESSITVPFIWYPYTYAVTYQPNDQLYFKSNEHLNYGISDPFTFIANATIILDQTVYNLDSAILATMVIYVEMPSFSVQLQDVDNLYPPIPIDFVLDGLNYSFNLQDVLLNITVYRLDFLLTNSPTIIVSSPSFQVTTPVTIEAYSIYSPVIATLYVDLPTVFEVQLQDENLYTITLPSFTANLLTRYSFLPSDYGLSDITYSLTFNPVGLNAILESPTFTLVQTATLTLDQSNYTIASNIIAMIDLNTESTVVFSVELQDADNLLAPISLPPFTVNSLSYYSFAPYNYNLTDMGYYFIVRPAGIDIILQSAVFQMSTDYFSLFPISTPVPEFARATTNSLCVTTKKFNVATTIISVVNNIAYASRITGKPQFLVPCGIVKYLKELNKLLITMSLRDALLLLIQKYDIPQSTPAITNQKRYQYPTVNAKVLKPILQYSSSFRLSVSTTGNSVNVDRRFVEKLPDARVLTICNDDTKTFSTLYTDMLVKATYWLNTLQPFKKDGDFTYCVVRPINGSLKQIITASISLKNNRLVFTPVILRLVLGFYNAYGPVDIDVMYSSNSIVDIYNYLVAAYEKIYLNPTTAL